MADTVIVSPIVATNEIDQTSLAEGVAGIGAAVIGRFVKGPAFQPVKVTSWTDFQNTFGPTDLTMYGPYAAKEYLKNQSVLNVVKVLGVHSDEFAGGNTSGETAGFTASYGSIAVCHNSGSGYQVATIIHSSQLVNVTGTSPSYVFFDWAAGYNGGALFTASYTSTDRNYVKKVLNNDPTKYETSTIVHYIWQNFAYNPVPLAAATFFTSSLLATCALSYSQEYSTAATPWIYSQNFGTWLTGSNVRRYPLFRVVAKDDGEWPNSNIKIAIENIRKTINSRATEYGYFNVIVRKFDDTDKKATIIEQFTDCTLDPDDIAGYVARKIGDRYSVWDSTTKKFIEFGDFDSKSKYIRVELDPAVVNSTVPETSLPWGFYGFPKIPSSSFSCSLPGPTTIYASIPSLPYVSNMKWSGDFDSRVHWGVAFNDASGSLNYGVSDRMKIVPTACTAEYDPIFTLDYLSSSDGAKTLSTDLTSSIAQSKVSYVHEIGGCAFDAVVGTAVAKFTLPLCGGFDGFCIHKANPIDNRWLGAGEGNSSTGAWNTSAYLTSYEVASIRRAVDIIADPETVDFNLLCIPGIFHPSIVNYAIQRIEDRGDAFYILDISGSSVTNVEDWMTTAQFDTNYGATYYSSVKYFDENANKDIWLPPSIAAFGAYAYNDRIAHPWFAPAGFTRAAIDAKMVKDKLKYQDRNRLYSKSVNPVASFPSEGIVLWGQRTLQAKQSALSSINVRRMMLYVRKTIASSVRFLVFQPNNTALWEQFVRLVRPILDDVFMKYGISKYKIVADSTTTTTTDIENLRMRGSVYIVPQLVAEAILLSFILSPQGTTFND